MARVPIEIVRIGNSFYESLDRAIKTCNSLQTEFEVSYLSEENEGRFKILNYKDAHTIDLIAKIKEIKKSNKGYHPFLIFITDSFLYDDEYENLFGTCKNELRIAILTTCNVPNTIIPENKMDAYFLHFIAHYALKFIAPYKYNHLDSCGCVFDFNESKPDLIESIKSGSFCDKCRDELLIGNNPISPSQYSSLHTIFAKAGQIINNSSQSSKESKPRIFIGSSSEGLEIANIIQSNLINDSYIEVWNQGTFDKFGYSYLECLEEAVNTFDYGVFVFSPDDKVESRGEIKSIARDNVIFELGMFIGKLTRKKAFLIFPKNKNIHILSDFKGITAASFDPDSPNLKAALGPTCERIRKSIK